MLNKPLSLKSLFKRANSSKFKYNKNGTLFEQGFVPSGNINHNENLYRDCINSYIKESKSYSNCIDILQKLYDENRFQLLEDTTGKIIRDVIPNISPDCIKPCIAYIESCNIGDINKERLLESAKIYKSIDRMINNHKKLSKRFELESFSNRNMSTKDKCNLICELVDTYNITPFIKFNIALEELSLLSNMSGINIDESELVEGVTNYFLLRNTNTTDDINSYKKAILESRVLSYNADSKVKYLTDPKPIDEFTIIQESWEDRLNNWKLDSNKNIDDLKKLIVENANSMEAIVNIMSTINDYTNINQLNEVSLDDIIENNIDKCTGTSAHNLFNYYIKENKNISASHDTLYTLNLIWESDQSDISYANAEDIIDKDMPYTFTTDEFDKYKLNNLISDSITAANMIDKKAAMKEYGLYISSNNLNETKYIDEDNYLSYLNEDNHIDLVVCTFEGSDTTDSKVSGFIESTVKAINNVLNKRDSIAYYTVHENIYDIHVESKYQISCNESEYNNRLFGMKDMYNINHMVSMCPMLETLCNYTESIYKRLTDPDVCANMDSFGAYIISEASRNLLADNVIDEVIDKYIYESANDIDISNPDLKQYKLEIPSNGYGKEWLEETYNILNYICDYYNPNIIQEGVNLNTLRLAWQAFKSKAKKFTSKAKELSRDMDATFNHFLKGIKSYFEVDRREQIITGQIRPSLSKLLQITIALAGVGVLTGSLYIPAITAVAGIALSKRASIKEKNLILDEIDIELKVLEREISKAETSGSAKKYRSLLTMQKNLQRERQRIHYNLSSKGKRLLPATAGLDTGGRD